MSKPITDHDRAKRDYRNAILFVRSQWNASREAQGYKHGNHEYFKRVEDNCAAWLERYAPGWNELDQLFETEKAGE